MIQSHPPTARRAARIARRAAVRRALTGVLALAALSGLGASSPEPPPAVPSLEALMDGMAHTAGVRAHFVERKEVALLSEPIETRGTLVFVPPDRMVRTTTEPSRSRLVISGDHFAFRDASGGDAVDLSANPLAREFVENFIVLFNGDLAALRQRYEPELTARDGGWQLTLRPRHRPLSDVIARVTLDGTGSTLRRMEMLETDGDRTTTTFQEVEVDHAFSPEELDRLFSLPGADADTP